MNVLLLLAAVFSTETVRDPFWPVGFEGERHAISAEPRFPPAGPVAPAEEEKKKVEEPPSAPAALSAAEQEDARWNAALRTLRFGGLVKLGKESAVMVNGKVRSVGEYVRADHDGRRFIWRVAEGGADRKLRLTRVKSVGLEEIEGKNK